MPFDTRTGGGKLLRSHYRRDRISAKAYLRGLGISKDLVAHWRLIWVLASLIALAIVVYLFAEAEENTVEWAISAVVAVGLLIGGYVEWTLARRESSLDKFYERLCIANESNEKLNACELPGVGDVCLKNTALHLYVYREIDNLEYVLQRYRHGFLDAVLAARGVRTFASRLKVSDFRSALAELGELGGKAGYLHTTSELIEVLRVRVPAPVRDPTVNAVGSGPAAWPRGPAEADVAAGESEEVQSPRVD